MRTFRLTLVVSPWDEVVKQTAENGNDEGRGQNAAVEETAESFAKVCEVLLGVVVTLGLDKQRNQVRTILVPSV